MRVVVQQWVTQLEVGMAVRSPEPKRAGVWLVLEEELGGLEVEARKLSM